MSYAWGWLLSAERPDKGGAPLCKGLQQCMQACRPAEDDL